MKELQVRSRQRDRRVDTRLLKSITTELMERLLGLAAYTLAVHLVSPKRMAEINQDYLQHEGPTDVITFDLRASPAEPTVFGELYVCVAVAETQAAEFRTSWQSELVRYTTHGVLHLLGFDDRTAEKRRAMKREENRLVRTLEKHFDFSALELK